MTDGQAEHKRTLDDYIALGRGIAGRYPGARTAFVSGSLIEGFGNELSDLDVFIIAETPIRARERPVLTVDQEEMLVEVGYLDGIRTDTEIWLLDEILACSRSISGCDAADAGAVVALGESHLDLAHRIRMGIPVLAADEFERIRNQFDWAHLSRVLAQRFMHYYNARAEDAIGAARACQPLTALLNSRAALGAAVDALLAASGSTNGKAKWREQKLRLLGDDELSRQYRAAELLSSGDGDRAIVRDSQDRLRLASAVAVRAAVLLAAIFGASHEH